MVGFCRFTAVCGDVGTPRRLAFKHFMCWKCCVWSTLCRAPGCGRSVLYTWGKCMVCCCSGGTLLHMQRASNSIAEQG